MNSFKIFFLCEDLHSLSRAIGLRHRLTQNCEGQVNIESVFCEYARLCHPRLRENAIKQVLESDMIIVSARGSNILPAFVQQWMDEISALAPEQIAYAEFLSSDSLEKTSVFHRCMEKWATERGTSLFSNLFPTPLPNLRPQAIG